MTRDIQRAIEQGRAIVRERSGLDIGTGDLLTFMETYMRDRETAGEGNAVFTAIQSAYLAGLAIGTRNA